VSGQNRDRKIATGLKKKQFSRGAKECETPAPDYIQLNTSITHLDRNKQKVQLLCSLGNFSNTS
jgi:hypothetical protein